MREALAKRDDRARPDDRGVALQVQVDQLGQRQLGMAAGSPSSTGSICSR
ncbi:MAG: hypothetical protein WKF94_10495 [Solirubrobacteraceae bacterium]